MAERPSTPRRSSERPESIGKRVAEAVDRLAEALDAVLRGPAPEPAYVPVRRPAPGELARYRRARRCS